MNASPIHNIAPDPWQLGFGLPFFLGVFAPFLFSLLDNLESALIVGRKPDIGLGLIVVNLLLVCFAAFARSRLTKRSWLIALLLYVGLSVGTLSSAFADYFVLSHLYRTPSHNLLPFEFLRWWVMAVIPISLGLFIGRFFQLTEAGRQPTEFIQTDKADSPQVMQGAPKVSITEHRLKCPHCGAMMADTDIQCVWRGKQTTH